MYVCMYVTIDHLLQRCPHRVINWIQIQTTGGQFSHFNKLRHMGVHVISSVLVLRPAKHEIIFGQMANI